MEAHRTKNGQRRPGLAARARGFTLIELMATVTVAAILAAVAIPSFQQFILSQRIRTAAYDVSASLTLARSEAVKRNASVSVTPIGGDWTQGWTVTSGATVLARHEALSNLTVSGPLAGLLYNGSGRLAAVVNPFQISAAGTPAATRCINVDLGGLPSSQAGSC